MKKLLFILPLILALGFGGIALITDAFGSGHPDTCQPCHGDNQDVTENINGTNYSFWNHNIDSGQSVWNNCQSCHQQIQSNIQNSPHSSIGCKCHSVLHVGYNFTNNNPSGDIYGVAYYYLPNEQINGIGKEKASANNLVQRKLHFDENNITSIKTLFGWSSNNGMEIEVGMVNLNKQFLKADGNGWQLCFNCHFISTNPSTVGSFKFIEGVWKIGIPQETLDMNPHAISQFDLNTMELENEAKGITANMLPLTISIIMGLIGALVAVLARK